MRALAQSLLDAEPVRLRAIVRFWDVEPTGIQAQELAVRLSQAMLEPAAVCHAWEAMPADQQQALQDLLSAEIGIPQRIFTRRWGEIRAMGPGRLEREEPWRTPVSPAEGLWYRGFIFAAFEQESSGFYEVIFVPPELRALLPAPSGRPEPPPPQAVPEPSSIKQWGDTLLDDACTTLAYLQSEPVQARASNTLPAYHRAQLDRQLWSSDVDRFAFLDHLIDRLSWLRVTDTRWLRPDPEPVKQWLQMSSGHQRLVLAAAWRQSSTWNDLFHVPTLQPQDTGAWRNDPLLARRAIARQLAACTPGLWYSIGELVARIHETDPDFQRPNGDYDTWYIRDAATGQYLRGWDSWDAVEGALIRYVVAGPLAWLGLVDLGATAAAAPASVFRVTPDGAAFLGIAELPSPAEPDALHIEADFTLSVPAAARYERFQLARVAQWVRTGDPFIYRLTPKSLERAQKQAIAVERILDFLGRSTRAPVPRFVEAALTRWEARGGEAALEHVMLLRLASQELAELVVASPFTRHLVREQMGATSLLIDARRWPELIVGLGKLGLLPDVSSPEDREATR